MEGLGFNCEKLTTIYKLKYDYEVCTVYIVEDGEVQRYGL